MLSKLNRGSLAEEAYGPLLNTDFSRDPGPHCPASVSAVRQR